MKVPTRSEVRRRRLELGLTQRVVAQRAGISQPLVARIETGSVDPRISTLTKIVEVLNQAGRSPGFKARDVMTKTISSVRPKDTVKRAASIMNRGGFSMLPVIEYGRLVGSITERKLVEEMSKAEDHKELAGLAISGFIQPAPPQVSPETDVESLSHLLDDHPLVLVTDGGRSLGVVTKADLLRTLGKKPRLAAQA
jgi:predicted transcriptional regulator